MSMASFSATLVRRLLALLQGGEPRQRLSPELEAFCRDYGISSIRGRSVSFAERDLEKVRVALRSQGIDPETPAEFFRTADRLEAAARAGNEKLAGVAPRAARVQIKAVRGPLRIAGAEFALPERAHLDLALDAIGSVGHDACIVVENFAVFDAIHRADWIEWDRLGCDRHGPVILYRGHRERDASKPAPDVSAFLRGFDLPAWAAFDVDPAGLGLALALPNLRGFLAPDESRLLALQTAGRGRPELFTAQSGWWPTLDATEQPDIRRLWALLQRTREGYTQEHFMR